MPSIFGMVISIVTRSTLGWSFFEQLQTLNPIIGLPDNLEALRREDLIQLLPDEH